MRTSKVVFMSIFLFLLFYSCQENTADDANSLEIDAVVEEQAAFGWQVSRMVTASNDIEGLTQNTISDQEEEVPELTTTAILTKQAEYLTRELQDKLSKQLPYLKVFSGDSLLFFEEKYVGERGSRVAFYYNFNTGMARVYEVVFQFPSWRNIQYDSSEIKADLNFTLDNSGDDLIKEIYNLQLFKESYFVNKIETKIEVTDYDGTEITGAIAQKEAYYHPDRFLTHLKQSAEINPDQSGSLREDFTYKDGKTAYKTVTFYSNYTGTFSRKLRDDTKISGEFNSVEDDQQGSYSETIDYPEGRYVDKITKSAIVSITLPDSIFNGNFSEMIYFASGKIDSSAISIQTDEDNGTKTTVLEIQKRNGAHGTIEIVETDNESTLNGNWTTWNDYYIIVSAEFYFDGSAHIHYEVYEPPYNPGDDPVILADYYISPDQSGNGTLSHNGQLYELNFKESGEATITSDGKSKKIDLFQ